MEHRCELCGEWYYHPDTFESPEVPLCNPCKESELGSWQGQETGT